MGYSYVWLPQSITPGKTYDYYTFLVKIFTRWNDEANFHSLKICKLFGWKSLRKRFIICFLIVSKSSGVDQDLIVLGAAQSISELFESKEKKNPSLRINSILCYSCWSQYYCWSALRPKITEQKWARTLYQKKLPTFFFSFCPYIFFFFCVSTLVPFTWIKSELWSILYARIIFFFMLAGLFGVVFGFPIIFC